MLAKEYTVPDVHDDLSRDADQISDLQAGQITQPQRDTPSILGIWRVGEAIYGSNQCSIHLGQPADAINSPRWDYAIKTFPNCSDSWQIKRHVSQVAAIGERVTHPNLIATLDASATAATPYIVMPRLHATSMHQQLQSGETKPLPVALWMTRQIAEALESIHQAGWVHGNVTPHHIMLGASGHAMLINLGCAQKMHTVSSSLDSVDRLFASPESLVGDLAAMGAMDIYSLGKVLWQWLTATEPASKTMLESVATLVESMLASDPHERPSISSIVMQLKQLEFSVLGKHIGPQGSLKVA